MGEEIFYRFLIKILIPIILIISFTCVNAIPVVENVTISPTDPKVMDTVTIIANITCDM
jgi:hypothetical protein